MEKLTSRQRQVLDYLAKFVEEHDYPPTLREISAEIGTRGTVSALRHLEALERKGFVTREAGSSRGITLKRELQPRLVQVPIVGLVHAGLPTFSFEVIEGYCALEKALVEDGTFFLRVSGESMIEDHILDGDLVLVRPQRTADNGDIVVATVNAEVTLKRFFREGDRIRLQPSNQRMQPIFVTPVDEFSIVGKVTRVVREV